MDASDLPASFASLRRKHLAAACLALALGLPGAHAVELVLPPLEGGAKARLGGEDAAGPRAIGVGREVGREYAARDLRWTPLPQGGSAARLSLRSPGAQALRAALVLRDAPAGARVRFGNDADVSEFAAAEIAQAAGRWGTFWGPVTAGEVQSIEIRVPAGAAIPATFAVRVEGASHLVEDPSLPAVARTKSAGACHVDAPCAASGASPALAKAARSVAKIVYTAHGATFTCTGTLVEDPAVASRIPYLLTARHCVDSPATAATVNTYWFLDPPACAGEPASPKQLRRGAALAYAGEFSDVALLRLNEPAPAQAAFSRIDATPMRAGDAAVTLHHPRGEAKKISMGQVVNPAEGTTGRLIAMAWLAGTTEPGSSGGGLFTERDGEYLLRGTLRGGSAACASSGRVDDPANRDYYARLDGDLAAIEALLREPAAPLVDYTDLWYTPARPGTGVSVTQHASNGTFVVWFTYRPDGTPMWLTVPGGRWAASNVFTGAIYRSRRDAGGTATHAPAGEATITFHEAARATALFTVDGTTHALELERQPF